MMVTFALSRSRSTANSVRETSELRGLHRVGMPATALMSGFGPCANEVE
jgi:hypothetical protein